MKESNKEILVSTAKSIFGAVPYAGTALNEVIFEHRTRIKQKRLNNFIEILSQYFKQHQDVNFDNIRTEHFGDIFEAILKRVVQTNSKSKLKRFRTILINELRNPRAEIELIDLYLDLISILSEEELSILYYHRFFDMEFEALINQMNEARQQVEKIESLKKEELIIHNGKSRYYSEHQEAEEKFSDLKNKVDDKLIYGKAEFYSIHENKFIFYKQRLFSRGLLIDNPSQRIGSLPFTSMGISEFGKEFIQFIKKSN